MTMLRKANDNPFTGDQNKFIASGYFYSTRSRLGTVFPGRDTNAFR